MALLVPSPRFSWVLPLAIVTVACVPTGSAPPYDAGPTPTTAATFKPSVNVITAPFEDNFDRPDGGDGSLSGDASAASATSASASASALVDASGAKVTAVNEAGADVLLGSSSPSDGGVALLPTADGGANERPAKPSNLGPNWSQVRTTAWRVENGKLCGEGAHNHGVWLNKVLPVNARIEFDAMSFSEEGDLKAEVWGDGHSYATGTSYTNATSYLAILGGWKNSLHVLARINEHGTDRREIKIDPSADDPRQRPVVRGQLYQFKIERNDGKTVRWYVNGIEYLTWTDQAPLAGQGHDHFGFNEWEAKVCFDNVKVTPL